MVHTWRVDASTRFYGTIKRSNAYILRAFILYTLLLLVLVPTMVRLLPLTLLPLLVCPAITESFTLVSNNPNAVSQCWRRSLARMQAAAADRETIDEASSSSYSLRVSYEGQSCEIAVQPGETVLAALERSGAPRTLCLPDVPADCRRGNCLTCTAQHSSNSRSENLRRGQDGLSPSISSLVEEKGYVLTCSSCISGDGVHLQLGENHGVWEDVYSLRLQDDETRILAREAMARVIRRAAERNVEQWAKETEEVLRNTGDGP
jgi:ferredoxin